MKRVLLVLSISLAFISCKKSDSVFKKLDANKTNITFKNTLTEDEKNNVLNYEYFYNGGGVAAADFNNDGLTDLYFSGNQVEDKLYLNKGNLEFEDITAKAIGQQNLEQWETGVAVVDINQDGWMDIYVSVSSNIEKPALRKNKLFINNKNLTFSEKAAEFGLDLATYSTHTAFFDYDLDGDLDAYLLNHNVIDFKRFDVEAVRFMRDSLAGDRLFRNNGLGKPFEDVTIRAGIKGNPIGFGLGVNTSDLNADGWPDIYVSNDYLEEDYCYINNRDGTFTDQIKDRFSHISYFSMGNEVADVNNDLLPDVFTTDMLPEDNKRQKLLFGPDKYDAYLSLQKNGVHKSFMRNMLHLNNGDGTFSEIGQLAGVSNTDWSWSPMLADFNNDGLKDLFVTNGYVRDYTNLDFMKYYAEEGQQYGSSVMEVVQQMPSTKLPNYIFKNEGNLQFTNKQTDWGFEEPLISNGALTVDLDNDGDLEIITNNVNAEASIYENLSNEAPENNYIQVDLNHLQTEGTKCYVSVDGLQQMQEKRSVRGFQSSVDANLHFGLGKNKKIDSLVVVWPDGNVQKLTNQQSNQVLKIDYKPSTQKGYKLPEPQVEMNQNTFDFVHFQQPLNDFNRQVLLPQMQSYIGPHMAVADVNADGKQDFFVGGGKGQAGVIFVQMPNGNFKKTNELVFKEDELKTDADAKFFDADGDKDIDLLVVSGGYEYLANDFSLQNRLYLNDGKGSFSKSETAFEDTPMADNVVVNLDFDHDGDQDIFVGASSIPLNFPLQNPSRLYRNDNGKFTAVQNTNFEQLGIIKDALAIDVDNDGWQDLVAAGEFTAVQLIKNNKGNFQKPESLTATGLWQRLHKIDIDKDGDDDIVAGNFGLNSQFKTPIALDYEDFDENGQIDPILSYFIKGGQFPAYGRDELSEQLVVLKKKYTTHEAFSNVTRAELLTNFKNKKPRTLEATELKSLVLINEKGVFKIQQLPIEAQFAPICALENFDFNADGKQDLILAGNQSKTRARQGEIDANFGQVFLNLGDGRFKFYQNLKLKGDVRDLKIIDNQLFVGINSQQIKVIKLNKNGTQLP